MGHRSITVALILGMVCLPLSCGGDDDDTVPSAGKGGKGGSAGKGGTAGKAGSSGKGGTAGKATGGTGGKATGGTAGKATGGTGGTTGGTAGSGTGGTGGSGTAGGGAGGETAGASGESGAGAGGQPTAGTGGEGGSGGAGNDAAAERMALCTAVCSKIPQVGGAGASSTNCGFVEECATGLCNDQPPYGWGTSDLCHAALKTFLDCLVAAPDTEYTCHDSPYGIDWSGPGYAECADERTAVAYCNL